MALWVIQVISGAGSDFRFTLESDRTAETDQTCGLERGILPCIATGRGAARWLKSTGARGNGKIQGRFANAYPGPRY